MNELELKRLLNDICDHFGIGEMARTRSTILVNVGNACRRSECLSRIESEHMESEVDGETGETIESSRLRWGESPEKYIKRYRSVVQVAST